MVRPKCCRVRRWAAWAMSSRNGAAAGDSKAARSSGCRSSRPKARFTSPGPARSIDLPQPRLRPGSLRFWRRGNFLMLFSLGEIFGGTGVSPVRAQAKACGYPFFSFPSCSLGTHLLVPKYNLGTRPQAPLSLWFAWAQRHVALARNDHPLERADMRREAAGKRAIQRENEIECQSHDRGEAQKQRRPDFG